METNLCKNVAPVKPRLSSCSLLDDPALTNNTSHDACTPRGLDVCDMMFNN